MKFLSQRRRQYERRRHELVDMGTVYVRYCRRCSHLWKYYVENLHSTKNKHNETIKQLLNVSKKLITDQTEIQGVSKNDWHSHSWQRTSLLSDTAIQLSTAKAFVFSASVLCLGKMYEYPKATDAWKEKMSGLQSALNIENWIELTESQCNSSGKISQDNNIADSR